MSIPARVIMKMTTTWATRMTWGRRGVARRRRKMSLRYAAQDLTASIISTF
jgi:hypothetical protein